MPASDHRLTTREMAQFVADGFLRFDGLIPAHINERIVDELAPLAIAKINQAVGQSPDGDGPPCPESLAPLSQCYPPPSLLGEMLRLPQVQGLIESLVGPDPLFDQQLWTTMIMERQVRKAAKVVC